MKASIGFFHVIDIEKPGQGKNNYAKKPPYAGNMQPSTEPLSMQRPLKLGVSLLTKLQVCVICIVEMVWTKPEVLLILKYQLCSFCKDLSIMHYTVLGDETQSIEVNFLKMVFAF